jgi:hypothetical protein
MVGEMSGFFFTFILDKHGQHSRLSEGRDKGRERERKYRYREPFPPTIPSLEKDPLARSVWEMSIIVVHSNIYVLVFVWLATKKHSF